MSEISDRLSEAITEDARRIARSFDSATFVAAAGDGGEATPLITQRNSVAIRVSRDMALAMGLAQPTDDERAEMDARAAEYERTRLIRENGQAFALEATYALADKAARAALDLHRMFGHRECAECFYPNEMGDHEDWPCDTVITIANAYGIEMPS